MAKIIVEVNEELKTKFVVKCILSGKNQREAITELIEKWLEEK